MERKVVVTGLGVISPVGNRVDEFWNNVVNGNCGITKLTDEERQGLPISVAGKVKNFDVTEYGIDKGVARKSDIFCQYALAAASQAVEQSGLVSGENIESHRFGVYIGSGIGGIDTFVKETKKLIEEGANRISPLFIPMMIANMASGQIAIKYKAQGPCLPVVTACATGTHSVGEAFHAIKNGLADAIITGGAEAAICPLAIGGFANSKALSRSEDPLAASLPFHSERGGFVMGEGAGVLVLEEYEHAKARGAEIIAEICGYGNTCDAYHYTAPSPDGIPAARAMEAALNEAEYKEGENLYINAHGTGTPLNDSSETKAIKLALGEKEAYRASISSTKAVTGHMLGAAGGVEAVVAVLSLRDGIVPPTAGLTNQDPACDLDCTPINAKERDLDIALSNSLGFGGHNGCIAFRKMK